MILILICFGRIKTRKPDGMNMWRNGKLNKIKKIRVLQLVSYVVLVLLLLSTVQTISISTNKLNDDVRISFDTVSVDENYYTWEDTFDNAQKIDDSYSDQYIVEEGKAEMYA